LLVIFLAAFVGFIAVPLKSTIFAVFYVSDYANPSSWYLGHTWSLAVEEQFYLLFPGILLIFGLRKTKFLLFAVILISPLIRLATFAVSGSDPIWVTKGFQANMDALAVGCLLALFYKRLHKNRVYRQFLASKFAALVPFVILLLNAQSERPRIFLGVFLTLINLLAAFCIDWAVTNYDSGIGKFLNSAPLVKLGVMSYSIYLWQQPFFNPDNPGFLTQTPFNFIGLALMTIISYYAVEKYSLSFRQKLEEKLFPKKSPLAEAQTSKELATN
jgi:peptidoglycan/LPS O-acetylase OafA/YrhL